ncbi:chymotrypsin-1-like [Schistocerca nitens]|uniref:chymotrypsin-1-like n=1 Tax=Schistocerca nitens TaxID=7011 RepID=UPI0021173DA6|nr:chymotrypsin-1-like [Schistocerca nitens]
MDFTNMRHLLVVYCLFGATALVSGHGGRIVGGEPAADHEFPALASLHVNGSHYCGANVLNERWLLTAAHCVIASGWSQQTILAGTNSQTSGGSVHQVEQVIIHENYTGMADSLADIALVRVSPPLPLDGVTVSTVRLPTQGQETEDGAAGVAAGWGYLSSDYGNETLAPWLQKLDVIVINNEDCQKDYRFNIILPEHICAGNPQPQHGVCGGDSGGPLYVDGLLVGTVDFMLYCGGITPPSVFTRVASFVDWIQNNIQ